jgi:uncharacterized lipoprotein YajG
VKKILGLGAMMLVLAGCSSDDGDGGGSSSIASGTLTGKVGGASWTFASAKTDAFLSDEQTFWVDVYAQSVSGCNGAGSGNRLILNVPKQVGTRQLGLQLNATFVVEGAETQNLIATRGAIRVDEITGTTLRGGVTMTYDADNSVSGDFDATICPSQ